MGAVFVFCLEVLHPPKRKVLFWKKCPIVEIFGEFF
jgi:hypothetical protein